MKTTTHPKPRQLAAVGARLPYADDGVKEL